MQLTAGESNTMLFISPVVCIPFQPRLPVSDKRLLATVLSISSTVIDLREQQLHNTDAEGWKTGKTVFSTKIDSSVKSWLISRQGRKATCMQLDAVIPQWVICINPYKMPPDAWT